MTNHDAAGIRDDLARDRTLLANERTFLAYLRTAIMLFVSGISVIKLFGPDKHFIIIGWLLIPLSLLIALYGYRRFLRMKSQIRKDLDLEPGEDIDM